MVGGRKLFSSRSPDSCLSLWQIEHQHFGVLAFVYTNPDLVCQLGSTRAISTLLQRVGRSGHSVTGFPKGRIFPTTRDELIECAALLDSIRRGELDQLSIPEKPLDILAQQIVASVASDEWTDEDLRDFAVASADYGAKVAPWDDPPMESTTSSSPAMK